MNVVFMIRMVSNFLHSYMIIGLFNYFYKILQKYTFFFK